MVSALEPPNPRQEPSSEAEEQLEPWGPGCLAVSASEEPHPHPRQEQSLAEEPLAPWDPPRSEEPVAEPARSYFMVGPD